MIPGNTVTVLLFLVSLIIISFGFLFISYLVIYYSDIGATVADEEKLHFSHLIFLFLKLPFVNVSNLVVAMPEEIPINKPLLSFTFDDVLELEIYKAVVAC